MNDITSFLSLTSLVSFRSFLRLFWSTYSDFKNSTRSSFRVSVRARSKCVS